MAMSFGLVLASPGETQWGILNDARGTSILSELLGLLIYQSQPYKTSVVCPRGNNR